MIHKLQSLLLLVVAVAVHLTASAPIETRALNAAGCGQAKVSLNRIVGGTTAQKGQYPWIASLRFKRTGATTSSHTCGCSIVDDQWILVAAHCFINSEKPENYVVRVGTHNQTASTAEAEATEYSVSQIFTHESFTMTVKIQNDIAMIKLKDKIDFSSKYVQRVCLPTTSSYSTDNKAVKVVGWGDTVDGNGKSIPDLLQHTDLTAQTDTVCSNKWGAFLYSKEQMICASADSSSPCVGDSGGPLMYYESSNSRYVQVGVVSFGESSCSPGQRPAVFTEVDNYLTWINNKMSSN